MASAGARRRLDGVLLLDKTRGLSSNAALQRAKRLYRAEKAGHTGTLDPLATGLLPICFGEATKFAQLLLDADKIYVATLRLGVTTTTGDAEGELLVTRPVVSSADELKAMLPRFVGRIAQVPPRHSALKRDGRKYYEYAREGVEIVRTAREVEVRDIVLTSWRAPEVELRVHCGKGTYIRALAEDTTGGLWIGTDAGLNRLRDGRVERTYTTEDGLPANTIRCLFRDSHGQLWAGTPKGAAVFRAGRFVQPHGRVSILTLGEDRQGRLSNARLRLLRRRIRPRHAGWPAPCQNPLRRPKSHRA